MVTFSFLQHVSHFNTKEEKKNVSSLLFIILLSFFVSCGTAERQAQKKLRNLFQNGQYDAALKVLSEESYKEEKSKLLAFFEKGMILHAKKMYYLSSLELEKAKELIRELYTTRIKQKIAKNLLTEKADIYYGEYYERSFVYFYLALNYLLIHQQGFKQVEHFDGPEGSPPTIKKEELSQREKRQELFKARSTLLSWDTLLKEFKSERSGDTVFKDDLLAKIFGGFIHELIGTRNDRQIALNLYKEAKKLIFQNYNVYPSFNKRAKKFKGDFSKLPKMPASVVKKEYVDPTPSQQKLNDFIHRKILTLTQKMYPRRLKRTIKELGVSPEMAQEFTKQKKKSEGNFFVLAQRGMIPEKVAKAYDFRLSQVMGNSKDSKTREALGQYGQNALTLFAADVLGLAPKSGQFFTAQGQAGLAVTDFSTRTASISFELPHIQDSVPSQKKYKIVVEKEDTTVVREQDLILMVPLSDLAQQAIQEHASSLYFRIGTRLALKHVAAISSAFLSYKLMSKNESSKLWAKSAAILQYVALSKVIEQTEKADLRYWSTLPSSYQACEFTLDPGDYVVKLKLVDTGAEVLNLGKVTIKNKNEKHFLNTGPVL